MLRTGLTLILSYLTLAFAIEQCQPGNTECWPTESQIETFKASLSAPSADCLESFPTLTSKDEEGDSIMNTW